MNVIAAVVGIILIVNAVSKGAVCMYVGKWAGNLELLVDHLEIHVRLENSISTREH